MNKRTNRIILLIICLGFLFLPFLLGVSNYFLSLLVLMCIYCISSLSLNLLLGYGGQVSIGHAGFLMIGAYASALLSNIGFPFIINIIVSGLVAAIVSFVIGFPSVRLRGHFLAVITLGFGLSIPQIALNWESLTNGYSGVFVVKSPLLTNQVLYIIIVLATIIIAWVIHNLINSSLGRGFISIRESEIAAQSVGINIAKYKLMLFCFSAFFTGIAGGLYAYWIGFVSPYDFTMTTSFLLLAMIVVGGLASIKGSLIGAILLSIIPHFADKFIGLTSFIIGVIMIIIILLKPSGLASIKFLGSIKKDKQVEVANVDT